MSREPSFHNHNVASLLRITQDPISPQNVSGFESYIAISSLRATIATTGGLVDYFAGEKQYATLSALLAANTLRITLLTVLEAYFIAKEGKKSNTNVLSGAIQKTINILQAWPEHYINDRATSLTYEIEQKYSGAADSFGRGRDKHPTGWYILHDSAPDPATGSLEGLRFHHHFPNKVEEVKKRYYDSQLAKTILPDLWNQWSALKALVLAGESLPLPPQPPVDTKTWFRLKSLASPSTSIDVVNDSTKTATDAQLQLAPEGNFSGQFWRFRPSKIVPGQWSLSTMFLGKDMCLDVYGDDKTRPHLAAAGNFSGQQWQLFDRKNGAWSLWNGYSGPDMFLTARSEPGGWLRLAVDARDGNNSSQKWALSPIQPIAEADP